GRPPPPCAPSGLLLGWAGEGRGPPPVWATGWPPLRVFSTGSDRLDAASGVTSAAGQFAAPGTASGTWMAAITTYTGGPVPEAPPVARLTVAQLAGPALTAKADGSTSTDADATPIASYHFNFGDGSAIVDTNAP